MQPHLDLTRFDSLLKRIKSNKINDDKLSFSSVFRIVIITLTISSSTLICCSDGFECRRRLIGTPHSSCSSGCVLFGVVGTELSADIA